MTWTKFGNEFFDQLAEYDFPADLDDACQLTHAQALHFLYSTEDMSAAFLKKNLRRIASSNKREAAAAALVNAGVWIDRGNKYEIHHHAEVFRQSLGYQLGEREKATERKRRQRLREKNNGPSGPPEGDDVTPDVTRDVLRTQSVSQSFSQLRQREELSDEFVNNETGEIGPRLKLVDQYDSDDFEDYIGAHDAFEKRFSS